MSLILRNLQSAIPIRRVPLRTRIELLRQVLGIQQFDLGVICVNNKGIQRLNETYRQNRAPTDVLSFPFHENLRAGAVPQPEDPDDFNLGDLFLGVEYIFHQCQENGEDYYDVLTFIAWLQLKTSCSALPITDHRFISVQPGWASPQPPAPHLQKTVL
ncbi:endoribonuclease YbeY isoform X2 [Macrotis lagotis]|uniref:endoribonuclease YbeY isoform X2 n=1 Tax=Macrotis lagotis TaxID=92651 RepID=UPI003D697995